MIRMHSSGFRWILASLLIEGIMLGILILSNLSQFHQTLEQQTNTRLNELSISLQSALSAPLVQMDYATAQSIMEEIHTLEGIDYLVVLDTQHQRLISVGWDEDQHLPTPEISALDKKALEDNRFDTRIALQLAGIRIGTLAMGVSTKFYNDAHSHALKRSLTIASLELTLSAILLIALNLWFSRRFSILAKQATAIADGDFDLRLDKKAHREYDQLVEAFNRMAETIGEKMHDLTAANHFKEELNQQITYLLSHDNLTHLASRYALDRLLQHKIRHKEPFTLLLLDVDKFKQINDRHGHQIGDQALTHFAQTLQANAPSDAEMIARYGGDEFIMVIHQTEPEALQTISQNLIAAFEDTCIGVNQDQLPLKTSIGYASFPNDTIDQDHLIQLADEALYHAKSLGRNRAQAYRDMKHFH